MYLQGKVVFEDGTPAPPNVVIERVCDGRPIPEDYTDTKGRFSFQIGQNSAMIPDASYSGAGSRTGGFGSTGGAGGMFGSAGRMDPMGGVSERELMGCELRANLAGYRSSSIELTGRRMFDNPDVGTIVLHSIAGAEGSTISFSSLNAPKKARKAYNNGRKEVKKKKPNWAKAEKELVKALEIYPEYASAWFILGQVHEAQKRPAEARDAYGKALAADEKYVNPYLRIALMDAQEQKWGDVRTTTNRILKLNPYHFPDAYFYNSIANLNLNNLSAAEKSAREAINLNAHRKFPQVEQILGIALAQQNNYEEAAVHLKKYLELVPNAQNADMIKTQISEIEAFLAQSQEAQPQQ